MTDPLLYGGAAAAAYGMAQLNRVVGPSFKSIGIALGDWTDYRLRNALKITAAADRLSSDQEDVSVHPRVAHKVVDDASWLDDDVMLEYAGGMLAASRSPEGKEERGAYFVSLLSNLTSLQIRLHHIIYVALATGLDRAHDLNASPGTKETTVWLPIDSLALRWESDGLDPDAMRSGLASALFALTREGLIGADWSLGGTDRWTAELGEAAPALVRVVPSSMGILLFLWGRGVQADAPGELQGADLADLRGPSIGTAVVGADFFNSLRSRRVDPGA